MRFEALLEKNLLPDFMIRWGARIITRARCKEITVRDVEKHRKEFLSYVAELKTQPIAINTKDANEQHYMQPTEFFEKVLGSCMKYCCRYGEVELSYRDWVKKAYDRTILAYDSHDFGCLFCFCSLRKDVRIIIH